MTHSSDPLPPLEGLTAVLNAARTGSFSAAAVEMGLTHGAISRRVQAVETWLGTRLFQRKARGVELTPAGHKFVKSVEEGFAVITRSAEEWRGQSGSLTVRLGVESAFAKLWMLPWLNAMEGDHGDLRLELALGRQDADLDGETADAAIRYGDGKWRGVQSRLLFRERLFPVATPEIARALGPDPTPESMLRLPLMHDGDVSQWKTWLAKRGHAYRLRPMDRVFGAYDEVLAAAEYHVGLCMMRAPLAQPFIDSGRLRPLSNIDIENPSAHWLVTRPEEDRVGVLRLVERLLGVSRPLRVRLNLSASLAKR